MAASNQIPISNDDEINLVALLSVIWRHKYLVVSVAGAFGLIAAYLSFIATPIYTAEVVVIEVRDGGMSAGAALANQFSGLASIAGINLGSGGGDRESQAVLTSRRLVEEFIKRNNIVPQLFHDATKTPSLWLAVKHFQESILSFREDKRTGTTRVTISWTDPATSAQWANEIVALANELIRARALESSTRNIAYLNTQITRTNVVDVQQVMYRIIESEMKTLMLANAKSEYAFHVVDPAVTPEVRTSPKRTVIVFTGLVLGVFVGVITAFVSNYLALRRSTNF